MRGQAKRSEELSRKHQAELKRECGKSRDLNGRLVKAEARANELQKKYDESKKNYLRIREERDRLKAEVEQAAAKGTAVSMGEGSVAVIATT